MRRFLFKGKRRTAKEIAALVGCKQGVVRSYYKYHKSLDGLDNRKRVTFSSTTGEGMNIDTLFLQGRIDDATYTRYLREFERQQMHGRGHKAYARIVDGRTYYEMSDKEDYFHLLGYDQFFLTHPIEDVFAVAAAALPIPDYRNSVVRETEGGKVAVWNGYGGFETVDAERWMPSGFVSPTVADSPFEDALDDCLKAVEDAL